MASPTDIKLSFPKNKNTQLSGALFLYFNIKPYDYHSNVLYVGIDFIIIICFIYLYSLILLPNSRIFIYTYMCMYITINVYSSICQLIQIVYIVYYVCNHSYLLFVSIPTAKACIIFQYNAIFYAKKI